MTLAEFTTDLGRDRQCFAQLRTIRNQIRQDSPTLIGPAELSMDMSGDYEVAIAEGATVVRVGLAIFDTRTTPDSYYWPDLFRPAPE